MAEGIAALRQAVRPHVVAKHLGQLGLVLAGLIAVPALVGLIEGEFDVAWRFFAVVAVLAAASAPMVRLHTPGPIQANEALAVSALAYILAALAGVWPLMGLGLPLGDAVFETISGVTTTGLSTLASVESLPHSILFARAWSQWYGGLGIAVLAVAMLASYDLSARRLVDAPPEELLVTTTLAHARRVTAVYVTLTVLGILALLFTGLPVREAVCHTLAAVSTGGFTTHDGNLAGLASREAQTLINLLALLGAVSLPAYFLAFRGQWRRAIADVELRALLLCTLAIAALLLALAWLNHAQGPGRATLDLVFLGVSAQSTSGFSTISPADLDAASKAVLIAAMTIGGSVGSTAGGIKLLRLVLVLRLLQLLLRRLTAPAHAVLELTVGGRKVASEEAMRTLMLVLLFPVTAFLSWLPFLASGYAPLEALFEVVSALGTVGLSTGIANPHLPGELKAVLCIDMLLGRLEFIAMLVLFIPATWIGRKPS
jgi:trk system potassium uptake protein TrkH